MVKLTREQIISSFTEIHNGKYDYSKVEYVSTHSKVLIICPEHGEFLCSPAHHKNGKGCPKCTGKNLSLIDKQKIVGSDRVLLLEVFRAPYGNNGKKSTFVKYQCLHVECGHVGIMNWYSMKTRKSCPACSGCVVTENNCVGTKRPDLIKYFVNEKEANMYTVGSSIKIQTKCPKCGTLKNRPISINHLAQDSYSCQLCGDGISVPEKFTGGVLAQLGIPFNSHKSFDWSQRRQYDFIFKKGDEEFICESHGMQHYISSWSKRRNLKEEQENDDLKYRLASDNGIKHYIIIDCRFSQKEWLVNAHVKAFSPHFDLTYVDWDKIWESCQKSIKIEVWEYWNNRTEGTTTQMAGERFNIDKATVRKYLRDGMSIGKCFYNPKDRTSKHIKKYNV